MCNILAFYSGGDFDQIDRLFRQSGLYRDKWERDGYRNQTIQKAVGICSGTFYSKQETKRKTLHNPGPPSVASNQNSNIKAKSHESKYPPYFFTIVDRNGKETVKLDTSELSSYIYEKGMLCPVEYALMRTVKGKGIMYIRNRNEPVWHIEIGNEMESIIRRMITPYSKALATNGNIASTYSLLYKEPLAEEYIEPEDINSHERYVIFSNGVLDLETMSLHCCLPETCFYTIRLLCDFNQNLTQESAKSNATAFMAFLDRITDNDTSTIDFLLQYMGVALSNIHGYRMKKWLLLYGEGNTGKSQLMLLLQKLLGSRNYASVDIDRLEERFGTSIIYQKRLVGDADLGNSTAKSNKMMKSLTGGDSILFEYKGENGFTDRYKGVLMFCANKMPAFAGDKGKHVYERIIPIKCYNPIAENDQDKNLLEKMLTEKESIVFLAMHAAHKVIENGYQYDLPVQAIMHRKEYELSNSIIRQFIDECCEPFPTGADGKIARKGFSTVTKIYDGGVS
ncbi:MAG: phage/plasmid primase, P4 family [Eubacteriaceae bacterium]|nr:phage/plasmid primase, P4 family [Eubacteriaceae bacterium]